MGGSPTQGSGAQTPRPARTQALTAVFTRLASRPIPRVERMMRSASERGYDPLFIGAHRGTGLASEDSWEGFRILRVGRPFPLLNGRRPLTYAVGVLLYNLALLRALGRLRPALLHASDLETLPAALLHRALRRVPVVYNVHDNLADRHALPGLVRRALNTLEGLAVLASDVAVVPEAFRRDALPAWCRSRVQVVRNAPEDQGPEPPRLPRPAREDGTSEVRVFYAGWLDPCRGLSGLLRLARENPWMRVEIAGEGEASIAEEVERSAAVYLGFLPHAEVLRRTREADFVAAFYDPARPINRAAAPNKLAEAFCAGRPVLVNDEVRVAAEAHMRAATLRVPYARIETIAEEVRALASDPERYGAMCRAARRVYEESYSWESVRSSMERVFDLAGAAARS